MIEQEKVDKWEEIVKSILKEKKISLSGSIYSVERDGKSGVIYFSDSGNIEFVCTPCWEGDYEIPFATSHGRMGEDDFIVNIDLPYSEPSPELFVDCLEMCLELYKKREERSIQMFQRNIDQTQTVSSGKALLEKTSGRAIFYDCEKRDFFAIYRNGSLAGRRASDLSNLTINPVTLKNFQNL